MTMFVPWPTLVTHVEQLIAGFIPPEEEIGATAPTEITVPQAPAAEVSIRPFALDCTQVLLVNAVLFVPPSGTVTGAVSENWFVVSVRPVPAVYAVPPAPHGDATVVKRPPVPA